MYLINEFIIRPTAQCIRIKCQVLRGIGILIHARVIVNELLNISWNQHDSRSCPIAAEDGGSPWEMGNPTGHPAID